MQRMIPPSETRMSGAAFIDSIRGLSREQVEARVLQEAMRGNMPSFVRPADFRPVTVSGVIDGRQVSVTFRASRDYIAIGTDQDYVRMPMSPLLARRIADHLGCVLPTARMVDLIDEEAKKEGGIMAFHAAPEIARRVRDPDTGGQVGDRWNNRHYGAYEGRWMQSPIFADVQSRMTDDDLIMRHVPPRAMRSGHKKDIVAHPEAASRRNVAIYHRGIQGLNFVSHEETYADYSHGARLIDRMASVTITESDGSRRTEERSVPDILGGFGKEPYNHLYRLLSPVPMDLGAIYAPRPAQARAATPRRSPAPPAAARPRQVGRKPVVVIGEIDQ
jgi:hypothetical protein